MSPRELGNRAGLAGARRLGINWCLRTARCHRLLVLCYHGVVPDDSPEEPYRMRGATRVSDFRWQLKTICRLFTPVSATDVLDHMEKGGGLPPRAVLVTFDDGFRNNLTCAAPVLERLGAPALIHVVTDHVGKGELLWTQEIDERIISWRHTRLPMPKGQAEAELSGGTRERWQMADRVRHACKRLPHQERIAYLNRLRQEALPVGEPWQRELYSFLSWEEVRELDRRGFSIGSHTATHPILTTLLPSDLVVELRESKSSIEYELKKPCSWLAYPNGQQTDFSPEVMAAAQQAGYKMAFSLSGRTNPEKLSPFAIDRVNVSGKLSADGFHAHLNGLKTWLA